MMPNGQPMCANALDSAKGRGKEGGKNKTKKHHGMGGAAEPSPVPSYHHGASTQHGGPLLVGPALERGPVGQASLAAPGGAATAPPLMQ